MCCEGVEKNIITTCLKALMRKIFVCLCLEKVLRIDSGLERILILKDI